MRRPITKIIKTGAPIDQADIDANNNKYLKALDGKLVFGAVDLSAYQPLYFDRTGTVITPHTAGDSLDMGTGALTTTGLGTFGTAKVGTATDLVSFTQTTTATPAYTNLGGTGNRNYLITHTSTLFGTAYQPLTIILDGDTTAYQGLYWLAGAVAGRYSRFDFGVGASRVITEVRMYCDSSSGAAVFQWQGSNDATNWTNIGSTWSIPTGNPAVYGDLSANTTGYRYYQILGVSGNGDGTPWLREIEFKIDDGGVYSKLQTYSRDGSTVEGTVWLQPLGGNVKIGSTVIDSLGNANIAGQWNFKGLTIDTNLLFTNTTSHRLGVLTSIPVTTAHIGGETTIAYSAANSYGLLNIGYGTYGTQLWSYYTSGQGEFHINTGGTAAGNIGNYIALQTALAEGLRVTKVANGVANVSIGGVTQSARLTLPAGGATAGYAPLKFTAGTDTTVAVAGQVEYSTGLLKLRLDDFALQADSQYMWFGAGKDVKIGYTGTVWSFDVAQATASIQFNGAGKDTDFVVTALSGNGNALVLDAATVSMAHGYATATLGSFAMTSGYDVQATATYCQSFGFYSRSTATYAMSSGLGAYATEEAAHSFGQYVDARSKGSLAGGYNAGGGHTDFYAGDATGFGQIALGYASGGGGEILTLELATGGTGHSVDEVIAVAGGTSGSVTVTSANALGDNAITAVNNTPSYGGSGYTNGDTLTVLAGNNNATVTVYVTDGVVDSVNFASGGADYSVGTGISTSGGTGSGCTIEITSVNVGGEITGISLTAGGAGYIPASGVAIGNATVNILTASPLGRMVAEKTGSFVGGQDVLATTNPNVIAFGKSFTASTEASFNIGFGQLDYLFTASAFTITDGNDIAVGTSSGTKFGTATSQKLGFWNTTPIVQPTTSVGTASFTANSGTAVNDASTFDGYTLKKVVKALRDIGLLA